MHRIVRPAAPTALSVALALAVATLAACGKSEPAAPAAAATPAAAAKEAAVAPRKPAATAHTDQAASAEEVAKKARADLSCPARIATPARAGNAPVDDVLGVRPGLTYEEAMATVLCSRELLVAAPAGRGFNLKTPAPPVGLRQGFTARDAEPHVVKTSRQIMKEMQDNAISRGGNSVREDLQPGQTKWYVATMGLPGQERVVAAAREERFAAGENPTIESVTAALLKKYGKPTVNQAASSSHQPYLRWAYDPLGRPITETSPLLGRCVGISDPDTGVNMAPDCGTVVQALLAPQRSNPALVDRMQVGVVDQAGGYKAISATEQAFGSADQQRRAEEVAKAAKNTKGPSL